MLTKPDIAFSVNRLSQFMHRPTTTHWSALKRLLRYLKGSIDLGLSLHHSSSSSLTVFTDADRGVAIQTPGLSLRRSLSSFLIYLGDNLVSWKSSKRKTVARSSTEAEYRAIATAASETIWIQSLLRELSITITQPTIYCDNIGATYLSPNPVFHSRMKHLALHYHFVREKVSSGLLQLTRETF